MNQVRAGGLGLHLHPLRCRQTGALLLSAGSTGPLPVEDNHEDRADAAALQPHLRPGENRLRTRREQLFRFLSVAPPTSVCVIVLPADGGVSPSSDQHGVSVFAGRAAAEASQGRVGPPGAALSGQSELPVPTCCRTGREP